MGVSTLEVAYYVLTITNLFNHREDIFKLYSVLNLCFNTDRRRQRMELVEAAKRLLVIVFFEFYFMTF